ncbi:MAG TPA: GxxExxY protein [Lentimicrobium sp.]|nr:GxxExxY protein [Lentimicrobium sp.]
MTENQIAKIVRDICFRIHKVLGPGLLESVYEEILTYELNKLDLSYERQKSITEVWESLKLETSFRADVIMENKVIVELKSIGEINPVHQKQVLTYLKINGLKLGLLVNFNASFLKDGFQRIAYHL